MGTRGHREEEEEHDAEVVDGMLLEKKEPLVEAKYHEGAGPRGPGAWVFLCQELT